MAVRSVLPLQTISFENNTFISIMNYHKETHHHKEVPWNSCAIYEEYFYRIRKSNFLLLSMHAGPHSSHFLSCFCTLLHVIQTSLSPIQTCPVKLLIIWFFLRHVIKRESCIYYTHFVFHLVYREEWCNKSVNVCMTLFITMLTSNYCNLISVSN
jgi:hypothetical protein